MKCDIPATVAFEHFNAAPHQAFRRSQNIRRFRISAERDDGRVLKQQNNIANATVFAQRNQLFLQTKASCVIDGAELENGDQTLG